MTNSTPDLAANKRYQNFLLGWYGYCLQERPILWDGGSRILEPLLFGDYPQVMRMNVGSRLPSFTKSQSEFFKSATDFIGINHYNSVYVNSRPLKKGVRNYAADMPVYKRKSKQTLYLHRHIAASFMIFWS